MNGHDECYQLLHSLRDSVGSVGLGSSSSPQRPLRSNFPNESSSSYHEREVNQGPRQTTSAKSKKPEFQTVDRKPWRLSDVLGEDTGDDVGDQDQRTAVCSVEDASESANQPKLCEEDVGYEEVEEEATETSRPRLVPRKSATENRVVSLSGSVVGVTGPPDAVKSSISSPTSSAPKKNTQSWEAEREYTRNITLESTDLHATALKTPVSSMKPETDEEEDSWASDDTENNEAKKRCEAVAKAIAQKRLAQTIESSSEEEKPSRKKEPEYQTDSDCDKSDWDSNNSAKGPQPATMDTNSAFARVRQQLRFSLGLDQSEEEEEEKQQEEKPGVKDIVVHSSPRLASKTALERPASNQSPWDSSDSEIASGKEDVVTPRPPNAGSLWLKSSPGFQQAEKTKLPLPENKPKPPTPEVDDRWDSSSTSDGDEIPMLGDEVTSEQDDWKSKPTVKVPSPTAAKSDAIGVSTADKPVTNLMQAIDYEDEEEMAPYVERSSNRDVHAMSVQMTVSRTLSTGLYRSQGYESDEAGAGLSPIEERTEDCFSFASNSSHSKKEENAHQSVCLSPGTPLSAEPLYVNAEWLKQFSEGDSTGTGIANLPSESRSLKITQTVVTDTDVKQNQSSGFEKSAGKHIADVEETSSVVCFEEKLVQALRALEREHRARQKVEVELDKARTQLAEAVLKAEATTSEESTSVPKDVSEITAECNLLRMKLNEETDHRQSLEAVYENLKKQLIAKEEELYRSRSQCVDLEMEVSQAKIRLKSARADYERGEVHPPDEGEDSGNFVSRDFARAPSVFSVEAPSVARRNYVPDGGPTLHINNLRELITAEKSRLKYQTDEMHDQLQELHSLFKNLTEKLVRCSVDDSSADRSKLLEIELRFQTTKEGLEFYKDKCNSLEGKLAESENIIESEQRQLEKLESELREVLREQSQKEEDITDTEECFLAKKKALLKTANLPPSETDSAFVVEQFLIERLLLRTRAEHEAVCLATERQAELLRVKAELAQLYKMKDNSHQNGSSQTTANAPVVPPMTASAGDEAGVSATANEPFPQWQSECMCPQAPIGSFENVSTPLLRLTLSCISAAFCQ
ncbi:unnamed protein product [Dibothriocephalus latus]|uniref:Uncharacterized protein n=1 Tax=Dibothriocephalus latus TaxID=60516 RepID=A0A3P6SDK5_DIBLA|nr:unnamed protein product [Dibothriocephalus latus]